LDVSQAFIQLFECLVGHSSNLVFLIDDLHLADSSTLALLHQMLEQFNQDASFDFVITVRDKSPRQNMVLENFLHRLSHLKRRFRSYALEPFEREHVEEFSRLLA